MEDSENEYKKLPIISQLTGYLVGKVRKKDPGSTDSIHTYKATVPKCGTSLFFPHKYAGQIQPKKEGILELFKCILYFLRNFLFFHLNHIIVDIPKSAMAGKKHFDVLVKIDTKQEESSAVGPSITLTKKGGGKVKFNNFVKIALPHNMAVNYVPFTEVVHTTHNGEINRLPTLMECYPEDVGAYFTVDEQWITIYTKSFSTYSCELGGKSRLEIRTWIFGTYNSDPKEIRLKMVMSADDPTNRLHGIRESSIVQKESKTVTLPRGCLSYKAKDIIAFVLQIKKTKWILPHNDFIQVKNLDDIIDCVHCKGLHRSPPDGAVFDINKKSTKKLKETIEIGTIHVVVRNDTLKVCIKRFLRGIRGSPFSAEVIKPYNKPNGPNVQKWLDEVEENEYHAITYFELKMNFTKPIQLPVTVSPQEPDNRQTLTDGMLVKLSNSITKPEELRNLTIVGLGIENDVVQTEISNHKSDITTAAHNVLTVWAKSQPNSQVAYTKLVQGLGHAQLSLLNKALEPA